MADGIDVDRGRLTWWLFGITLGAVVLYVVYRFIGTFVFGVFLYYATRPVFERVRPRVKQRSVAAAASLALLVLPALLVVGYTVAIGYREFRKFADAAGTWAQDIDLGAYEPLLETYLDASQVLSNPQQLLTGDGMDVLGGLLLTSVGALGTLGIFALHLFVIVAIAFYLLRDDHRLSSWLTQRVDDESGVLEEFLDVVDDDFNNIFFGNILNAVATGTIGAIVYTVLNLGSPQGVAIPYAALVGLLAGIASLIPVVGMKIVYVPVATYLFALPLVNQQPEAMWFPVAFAAVSFVVVDTIPDLILRPYVSGRRLHMGALMLAYVLGPLLFGWYGLFLAPMLLVLVVHFSRIVMPELLDGRPIQPHAVEPAELDDEPDAPAARESTDGPVATNEEPESEDDRHEGDVDEPDLSNGERPSDEVGAPPRGETSDGESDGEPDEGIPGRRSGDSSGP